MRFNRLHEEQGTRQLVEQVRGFARPLARTEDLDPLLDRIGDARHVLLGEASHGTADYYTWRRPTRRKSCRRRSRRECEASSAQRLPPGFSRGQPPLSRRE